MPNYSLIANSQFKARSFEDLLKPYAMYTNEYRAQEDALSDLATKADVWQGLANEQTDPVAYAQYTNYANALKEQAAVIADRGLDPTSRQAMLNLKRRYASEITPIEQAFATRKAQADEQRKALLQNPTLMLSRRADATSLDRYLENPNLGYESYSGALLTQQVGQAAQAIAKELRNYGKGKPLDGFTRTWLQQHGYTAAEVAFAINHPDDPRANGVLNSIVNNVIADSGMSNWADSKTMTQAYNYARQGLWQAVGQTQIGTYTDEAAKLAAQEAAQRRAERRQAALTNPTTPQGPPGSTVPIHFTDQVAGKKMKEQAAKETAAYFQWVLKSKDKKSDHYKHIDSIRKYWEQRGGWNAAIQHWTTDGFNGKVIGTEAKNGLQGHLKSKGFTQDMVDTWTSPYVNTLETVRKGAVQVGKQASGFRGDTPLLDHIADYAVGAAQQLALQGKVDTSKFARKDWGNWQENAKNAYTVNGILLHDSPEQLSKALQRTMTATNPQLKNITNIDAAGNYTYSDAGRMGKLLKDVDLKNVTRTMMSNGDYLLTWPDGKGGTQQAVLPRSGISKEQVQEWQNTDTQTKRLMKLMGDGLITADELNQGLGYEGMNHLFNSYLLNQDVDVEDYKIK